MEKILNFKDKTRVILRLIQSVVGVVFLIAFTLVAPIKELGTMAIPAILIALIIIFDGFFRFLAIRKGISINYEEKTLTYPDLYKVKSIKLSDVISARATYKAYSGATLGTSTYSYNIQIHTSTNDTTMIFSSENIRDKVLKSIREARD